jgi:hypothetical protein
MSSPARLIPDLDVQQPRGVPAEDRPSLIVVEPTRALDKADRINLAHIGWVIGAYQHVVGAILVHQIFELVVGKDDRVEIEPLQVGGRHPVYLFAAIGPRCRGVIYAAGISRQIAAAMRDHKLQVGVVVQYAAEDQVMDGHRRIERVADHVDQVMVGKPTRVGKPGRVHEDQEAEFLDASEDLAEPLG